MSTPTETIKQIREQTGAGVMDCRNALIKAGGDVTKALEILKELGLVKAQKKQTRAANQGIVEAYIHGGGRIGAMIELNCETDFVARTAEFKQLAHDIVMQVAAMSPLCISVEEMGEGTDTPPEAACLLLQPYIKDQNKTIKDILNDTIARVGENIKVRRFARFEIGC